MYDKTKFIYVGIDLHKEQHTAVIMDCFNEKLGEITSQNKSSEFGKLVTKSKKYCTDGKQIVFALENSYGYGRALAAWLIERDYLVKDVNHHMLTERAFSSTKRMTATMHSVLQE